jgi:predicted RNase H-like HicB family nuclease
MNHLEYPVLISPLSMEDGGGFLETVPDLLGCMSDGETPEEAVTNVQDAILTWIEAARELGREIPAPSRQLALA